MISSSTIHLLGESGAHLTFSEAPCPGRMFLIVESTGGYIDAVKCEICHRVLNAQGAHLADPLNEEPSTLHDVANAAAAVKATYTFRHGGEERIAEIPTKCFRTPHDAYCVFKGTTEEAALLAWPWADRQDRLEKATVKYCLRQNNEWQTVEEHAITP